MLVNRIGRLFFAGSFFFGIGIAHADSPFDYGSSKSTSPYQNKLKREQVNPWNRKPPVRQDAYGSDTFHYQTPPDRSGPRFVSQQELDELNSESYFGIVPSPSDRVKPLPVYEQNKTPSTYSAPYARQEYDRLTGSRTKVGDYRKNSSEINKKIPRPSMYPVDPSQFGVPFAGPFKGVDAFMYE